MLELKSLKELLDLFDPSVHQKILNLAARAEFLVVFENPTFDSSAFGDRTVLKVGYGCTIKSVEAAEGEHLYDLPSQRQYPVRFWRNPQGLVQ